MSRRSRESIVDVFLVAPWWASVALAPVAFGLLYGAGSLARNLGPPYSILGQVARGLSGFAAIGFLVLAAASAFHAWRRSRLGEAVAHPGRAAALGSKDFEIGVAGWLAKHGYTTEENLAGGADGGVDVEAWRDGKRFLVQCKHWRSRPVGVDVVRELLGAVTAARAAGGILVTSGTFTEAALAFARGQPLELIDGARLGAAPARAASSAVECPACGSPMVKRTAGRGANAGRSFWGCPKYPNCRGTRPI